MTETTVTRAKVIQMPTHPTGDALEAYATNPARRGAARIVEHLGRCKSCREHLARIDQAFEFMRSESGVYDFTHVTPDGPVRVWCERHRDGWAALVRSVRLSTIRKTATPGQAAESAQKAFYEMFPRHECNEYCVITPAPLRPASA